MLDNDVKSRIISKYFNWASFSPDLGLRYSGNSGWDSLVETVKSFIGELLNVPPQDVSLHHNTTGAFQRIVTRLGLHFGGSNPVLLISDLEYPGIVALLDEQWPGPMVMVNIAESIWSGKIDLAERTLVSGIRRVKPNALMLSHVSRSTGFSISPALLTEIRNLSRAIIIIDAAQSVGNILIQEEIQNLADFFVFSGHKWLRGLQTLGIVVASQTGWSVDDPAQGYSIQAGSRGTGSEQVLSSLAGSLREYPAATAAQRNSATKSNAKYLATKLGENLNLHIPALATRTMWHWSGIVAVPLSNYTRFQLPPESSFEILRAEAFRNANLGVASAGPRYLMDFPRVGSTDRKDQTESRPIIRKIPCFCNVPVPIPYHGAARICVAWDHSKQDIDLLIKEIRTCNSLNHIS